MSIDTQYAYLARSKESHLSTVTPRVARLLKRAWGLPYESESGDAIVKSPSRVCAVKAMCLECMGYEAGAIDAIRDCQSVACPLHAVRPFQDAKLAKIKARRERIVPLGMKRKT